MKIVDSTFWVVLMVLLPLAGAALSFLINERAARFLSVLTAGGILLCSAALFRQVAVNGPFRYPIGGWGAPLGIDWQIDGLTVLMLLMAAVVGAGVTVYGFGYFPLIRDGNGSRSEALFWPLWLFLWASLNALFLSADIFNLYVTLELVTISAVALVTISGGKEALWAGMRYLLVALLGSLSYLIGVALLYTSYGTLDIIQLGGVIAAAPLSWTAAALMTAGLLAKTALFPLHFWLPPAHANAPSPVSAVLSALVVKASFYLVLRLWFQAFGAVITPGAEIVLGVLGAAAILWGSVLALRQVRIKMLIAYSTVAQLGYLFLVFPLAMMSSSPSAAWASHAMGGGIYQALSHASAKAAMFMVAGSVMHAIGHDRIEDVAGISHRMPVTVFAFGIAGLSLMGLPPSGGFIAKWLLLTAAFESGQWWWAFVLIAGGLLAAAYVSRVLRFAFTRQEIESPYNPVPVSMQLATLGLAIVSLALGFTAAYPLELIGTLK